MSPPEPLNIEGYTRDSGLGPGPQERMKEEQRKEDITRSGSISVSTSG